ncbi:MAG: hypothetical protein IKC94_00280 [Lentisphaeria bacterium]|nr:hypothetical protein [Lentisphaeria bacterium]
MFFKKFLTFLGILTAGLIFSGCANTHEFRFNVLFSDGAVLQRNMPLPVWGKAAPRAMIRCTLGEASAVTVADSNGNFRLYLPPQSAARGMVLSAVDETSGRRIISENISIGEVYLFAGQSNMAFRARHTPDWEAFSARQSDPQIRFFQVAVTKYPGLQSEVQGAWKTDDPEVSGEFSAVAYYFAKSLRAKHPDIPVGIIGAYLGGAAAETFISREALLQLPDFAGDTAALDTFMYLPEHYSGLPGNETLPNGNQVLFAKMDELFPQEYIPVAPEAAEFHREKFDDSQWQDITLPDSWTVAGFNHAGIFWFRKTVDIPAQWAGKDIVLGIGAADKADETYFNGVKIGATGCYRRFDHFMSPRYYTIPGHLVKAGRNVIAVRVSSSASIATDGGLIGPEAAMKITCGEESVAISGSWKIRMEKNLGTIGVSFMQMLGPGAPQSLHILFDNMIYPLIPYAMRGAVWYQGEADALCYSKQYEKLLNTLIADWRNRWGQKEFDFIIIQLPGYQPARDYQPHSTWAVIREAQRRAALHSGASLIVTLRDGDVDDIHPRNKRPVGERAAVAAMSNWENGQFRQSVMPVSCRNESGTFIVVFDRDIVLDGEVRTLMLAGSDGNYYPASGRVVNGRELHIVPVAVPHPRSVRYAWSNNPAAANLTDKEGNLLSPFELKIK